MANQETVSPDDWLAARLRLLEQEKALTLQRDAVSRARRELPRVHIDKTMYFRMKTVTRPSLICLPGEAS